MKAKEFLANPDAFAAAAAPTESAAPVAEAAKVEEAEEEKEESDEDMVNIYIYPTFFSVANTSLRYRSLVCSINLLCYMSFEYNIFRRNAVCVNRPKPDEEI
jgi:hypothetical protein